MATMSQLDLPERSAKVQLPGFGLPVEQMPDWNHRTHNSAFSKRFPHAIVDYLAGEGIVLRERRMLEFINTISDKPDWERKVFDEEIVLKWRREGCVRSEEINDEYLSEKMFNFCIAELREKANLFKKTGIVAVLDSEATLLKSDSAISNELRQLLICHAHSLEDVPDKQKDWHPGSDEKVLDLLHPSLFPLVYGLSKVLPTGTVPLLDCTAYSGKGEHASGPSEDKTVIQSLTSWDNTTSLKAWGSFQWLPSNIHFKDGGVEIASYINNLHPKIHEQLYKVLEQFVDRSIPLWNEALSWFHNRIRIPISTGSDEDYTLPRGLKYNQPGREDVSLKDGSLDDDESDEEDYLEYDDDYQEWERIHRILVQPEPRDFVPFAEHLKQHNKGACAVDLRERFSTTGLQVIFKLANIHLDPEKPEYSGGSWHVEGALNEHICATSLYYYDEKNVTESHLAFRQSIDSEAMTMKPAQNEYQSLEEFYGIENNGAAIQELGKIVTREGRLIAFPNVLQHSVQPFRLSDATKPGHRKILAMFLVDPHIPVLSTANVPPQRRDWWAEEVRQVEPFATLPLEIFQRIIDEVQEFPISWQSALEIREKLMSERAAMAEQFDDKLLEDTFNFCEH